MLHLCLSCFQSLIRFPNTSLVDSLSSLLNPSVCYSIILYVVPLKLRLTQAHLVFLTLPRPLSDLLTPSPGRGHTLGHPQGHVQGQDQGPSPGRPPTAGFGVTASVATPQAQKKRARASSG